MSLAECAAYTYRAYHANYEPRWYGNNLELKEKLDTLSLDEYVADTLREHEERWAPGGVEEARDLYAGSRVRAKLSDAEIAVLANKYDPYNMDDAAFDDFLDDLQSMGAISEREKGALGYHGIVVETAFGLEGMSIGAVRGWQTSTIMPDGSSPMFYREEADGDIVRWLSERVLWEEGGIEYVGDQKLTDYNELIAQRNNEMYRNLNDIVSRMAKLRPESKRETTEDAVKKGVVEQFANADSQLYRSLIGKMKDRMKDAAMDEQEQDVVDALDDVLEAMNERKANGRKSNLTQATAKISTVAQTYKPGDPRRVQLEQAANQMERMAMHLEEGTSAEAETLTQRLIREEQENASPGIPDLFGNEV